MFMHYYFNLWQYLRSYSNHDLPIEIYLEAAMKELVPYFCKDYCTCTSLLLPIGWWGLADRRVTDYPCMISHQFLNIRKVWNEHQKTSVSLEIRDYPMQLHYLMPSCPYSTSMTDSGSSKHELKRWDDIPNHTCTH